MPAEEQLITDGAQHGHDLDGITAKGHAAQTLILKKQEINLADRITPYMHK